MASSDEDKQRLIAQMERSRLELGQTSSAVGYNFNIPHRFSRIFEKYSWGWVSLAAIMGWILSRLPARKQKIYIHDKTHQKVAKEAGAGVLVGVLWSGLWSIARPILTAYIKRRMESPSG
jgi:hypothetical protein